MDLRTLTGINYAGWSNPHSNDFGRSHFFSEDGKIVFIGHSDGSEGSFGDQGVFVWDASLIPESSSVFLLLTGGLTALRRNRRADR